MFENFFGKNEPKLDHKKIEEAKEKKELNNMSQQRDNFLAGQKYSQREGSKHYENLADFRENPQKHLLDLYKKDITKEEENKKIIFNKMYLTGESAPHIEDFKMHIDNIAMLQKKVFLIEKYGSQSVAEGELDTLSVEKSQTAMLVDSMKAKFSEIKSRFTRALKPAVITAASLFFFTSPIESQKTTAQYGNGVVDDTKDRTELTVDRHSQIVDEKSSLDIYHRFTKKDPKTGEVSFALSSLIAPIGVGYESSEITKHSDQINVPFQLARQFGSSELTNKEDIAKLEEYLRRELTQTIGVNLTQLDFSDVYGAQRERRGKSNLENENTTERIIKKITIKGTASPEALKYGWQSLVPGSLEIENERMSKKRVETIQPSVEKILAELGYDTSKFEVDLVFEEVQFTDEDVYTLVNLADKNNVKGSHDFEKILNLCEDYKKGVFNENEEATNTLKEILDSKRSVVIDIEMEDETKKEIVVPIPLALLGLLFLLKKRRKEENGTVQTPETSIDNVPPNEGVREIFSETEKGSFEEIYNSAEDGVEYSDLQRIEQKVLREEIQQYIGDTNAIDRGLDYFGLIQTFSSLRKEDETVSLEDHKMKMAETLLIVWQAYDRKVREEKGLKISSFAIDYRLDAKKVIWAKQASPLMLNLVDVYDEDPRKVVPEIENMIAEYDKKQKLEESRSLLSEYEKELKNQDQLLRQKEEELNKSSNSEDEEWRILQKNREELIKNIELIRQGK